MARPGYVTHCPWCFVKIETPDSYADDKRDEKTGRWIRRPSDPDWVIQHHPCPKRPA